MVNNIDFYVATQKGLAGRDDVINRCSETSRFAVIRGSTGMGRNGRPTARHGSVEQAAP
jgi:hypothetical protein